MTTRTDHTTLPSTDQHDDENPGTSPVEDTKATSGMPPARREQFEADLAQVQIKTGSGAGDARLVTIGTVLMGAGALLALISFIVSGSQDDTRDVLSTLILATFGLSLVVGGAAMFLRYSIGRFLRVWLLRLIYEQQSQNPDA